MKSDRTLLPPASFEFVVVSDTHYMLDRGEKPVEFTSRLKQSARAETAFRYIATLDSEFIIHLGDLVQEYPDTAEFQQAMDEALEQIERCGLKLNQVAGNHDCGDKLDGTMPTSPVTRESLDWYHQQFGPSWYSFSRDDCHFVVLNSQIMNGSLPEAAQQRQWLEQELTQHTDRRLFLFLHLPPYLWDEHEPGLGNYENLDQPDRDWLLDLVKRHGVEMMLAGHVHTSFYDYYGSTRYMVANSTSFTRPGFCHMYTAPSPPERGRDDAEKLGFYLFRIFEGRADVHFLRTGGQMELPPEPADGRQRLVTCTPAGLGRPRVGISLRQAITPVSEVPLAWPASIREQVRNDYPLLACSELGATCLRTQWNDLTDPLQSRRLAMLRSEGVRLTATSLWSPQLNLPALVEKHAASVDAWEVQLPGTPWPTSEILDQLKQCNRRSDTPIALSAVVPGEIVPGKQHPRTRHGYRDEEIAQLNERLAEADVKVDRVSCMIPPAQCPWSAALAIQGLGELSHIGAVDLVVELSSLDDSINAGRAAAATFATAMLPNARVYFDPLIDLDRSMDICHGLLDTYCNPRPAFHVVRCLNTILFSSEKEFAKYDAAAGGNESLSVWSLGDATSAFSLLLPQGSTSLLEESTAAVVLPGVKDSDGIRLYRLQEATATEMTKGKSIEALSSGNVTEPILLAMK